MTEQLNNPRTFLMNNYSSENEDSNKKRGREEEREELKMTNVDNL